MFATSTARLAAKLADTEFNSGCEALVAAKSGHFTLRQRDFLLRVAHDEFHHARLFGAIATCESDLRAFRGIGDESAGAPDARIFFSNLVVGESAAGFAFCLYRTTWSALRAAIPEFDAIQRDEAVHRFGALLHLRRICPNRTLFHVVLAKARVRLFFRGAGAMITAGLSAGIRILATAVMLAFWPLLVLSARRRIGRHREQT